MGFPCGASDKETACQCSWMQVGFLGGKDSLEEGMVTLSSILAWSIPWTGKSGRL